ncbi:hypothetical protein CAPTEDRAFT_191973 [Capitella teleta]|uniref:Uncharacterized protein n=1 Tax=Capitella teleta TaxID=283909 RepID=R7TFM4_CAPTE|nr:hypothetical protein CAPTEDRAFT_191973 [Capitella teleta]|eukprot:ELT90316.1 hypothetical protein CAPTEDRAFT_191973 [Capitella teleta]
MRTISQREPSNRRQFLPIKVKQQMAQPRTADRLAKLNDAKQCAARLLNLIIYYNHRHNVFAPMCQRQTTFIFVVASSLSSVMSQIKVGESGHVETTSVAEDVFLDMPEASTFLHGIPDRQLEQSVKCIGPQSQASQVDNKLETGEASRKTISMLASALYFASKPLVASRC